MTTTTAPRTGNASIIITEQDISTAAVLIRDALIDSDSEDVPTLAQVEAATRDALSNLVDYACENAASLALEEYRGITTFKHGFEKSLTWQARNRKAAK